MKDSYEGEVGVFAGVFVIDIRVVRERCFAHHAGSLFTFISRILFVE